jgi:hypothetical protein
VVQLLFEGCTGLALEVGVDPSQRHLGTGRARKSCN